MQAGYLDKAVRLSVNSGVVTPKEGSNWMLELERADEAGEFFSTLTLYCVRGHKPQM